MTDKSTKKTIEVRHYGCKACGRSFDVPYAVVRRRFITNDPIVCLCKKANLIPNKAEDEFPWNVARHGKSPWWMPFLFTGDEGIRCFVETCEFSRWADNNHQPFPHADFEVWLRANFHRPLSREGAAWMFLEETGRDPKNYPFAPEFKVYVRNQGCRDQFLPEKLTGKSMPRCPAPPSASLDLHDISLDEAKEIVAADAEHYFNVVGELAMKWYGISISNVPIRFDLDDPDLAGISGISTQGDGKRRISLNPGKLQEDPADIISSTLPHEIAHICAWDIFGTRIPVHGPEWRSLMHFFGQAHRIMREERDDVGEVAPWERQLEAAQRRV